VRRTVLTGFVALATALTISGVPAAPATATSSGDPGDAQIVLDLDDSGAGGTYEETFQRAYVGTAPSGTPVYVYVPAAYTIGTTPTGVRSLDPTYDWNPADDFTPCADKSADDYVLTQAQIDRIGDELTNHILAIDEAHYGEVGLADPSDPTSDAMVMVVYDLHDSGMYDCEETTYTAGYFAPEFIESAGMNVIAVDAFDWANRTGDQTGNPDGRSELYEGVVAHELEHLLHNYSDAGELSWTDEGLADFAIFLNGYDVGGSHLTYQQVLHNETSLTRWGGGLNNYGAAYTFFQYLWEQAGGNGDGTYEPDGEYDPSGGDLLIKTIFAEQANGMEGVQNAIDTFNGAGHPGIDHPLPSAKQLFKGWSVAVYLDDEGSDLYDIKAVDFGDPAYTTWTIDVANDVVWDGRGQYHGALPDSKWDRLTTRPDPTALPFGTTYQTFRNPGPTFSLSFSGEPTTRVAPHSEPTHWYAGYESQSDHVLDVDAGAAPTTIDFWTWFFIEEGYDYGFVEAEVGGAWQTVPLVDDDGNTVTTDDDPFGNNTEGNGLTGTSGGAYFVDDPTYLHVSATLPAGTTDVRFRYSTDAAYLDTGWFVDDVQVDGAPATVSSTNGWSDISGTQQNDWSVQLIAACDLTPGTTGSNEIVDSEGNHVYQFSGNEITAGGFSTACANGTKKDVAAVISNLPGGELDVLDADYEFRLVGSGKKK
jgi:immune inhibitor A